VFSPWIYRPSDKYRIGNFKDELQIFASMGAFFAA
jgi:hypothetical protein